MTREKPEPQEDQASQGGKAVADQDWYWAEPRSLKVNPAFEALIPLQSKGEYRALDQSIQAEGCRDPLLVWKGKNVVLDGHTRRMLCLGHKKQVKVRAVDLPDEKAAVEYILQIQRQRRNLTREAMSYFRGAEYNAVKKTHGGRRISRKARGQNDPLPKTAAVVADQYGVSEKTIKRDGVFAENIDKIVAEYGDPEVKRKLLGADVKLTHGTARVFLKMPAGERKAAVDYLVEMGETPRDKKGSTARTPKPREMAQSLVNRLNKRGEGTAVAVFKQMARLLGFEVPEKASDK